MESLIFWQNAPSIHQAPLIREIACQWKGEVLCVCESDISEERLQQGWTRPDYTPANIVIAPSRKQRQRLIARYGHTESVHIFSGFYAFPETYHTMKRVSLTQALMGVYSEPGRSDDGIKAIFRRLRYKVCGIQWGRRLDFLIATGHTGVQWFQQAQFPPDRIFPFGYFVEALNNRELDDSRAARIENPARPFRLIFVGQLMPWKGLDLLLRALAQLRSNSWSMHVVGRGPLATQYKDLAKGLGIGERIHWFGARPNAEVRQLIGRADTLVLPSRYDGWGAVINESLAAGTPVITSGVCGAADLIRSPDLGHIFRAGSVELLSKVLHEVMECGAPCESRRERIRAWADVAIAPHVVASYLLEIVRFSRGHGCKPMPPWHLITKALSSSCQA